MSTYENLKGLKVKYLSADTSGDRAQEGELFYNSSDFKLKSHIAVGAWSAGSILTTARPATAGAGTQTAALVIGGYLPPPGSTAATEEYNGVGWTTGGNLNVVAINHGAAGTQTAGLEFAGGPPNKATTEEYDGSSWTESGDLANARRDTCGTGTQTAALCVAGTGDTDATEEYGGASWTSGGNLNTARPKAQGSAIGLSLIHI